MDDGQLSQDDIDALLAGGDVKEGGTADAGAPDSTGDKGESGLTDQAGIDELIAQMGGDSEADAAPTGGQPQAATVLAEPVAGQPFQMPEVDPAVGDSGAGSGSTDGATTFRRRMTVGRIRFSSSWSSFSPKNADLTLATTSSSRELI